MKQTILIAACSLSMSAFATPSTAQKMDALHQQMESVRQSLNKEQLKVLRDRVEKLNAQIAAGRPDTGCYDASGMLRAMSTNIELQWEAQTQGDADRHLKFWRELNTKYRTYSAQCAQS
ncbi:hypothetical protein [Variovorax paradoxus]|uniref:Uncharacterized protein n=1 Tax=Variovorax paradoxus TaxID=34073 RepID=A0A0H2LWX5_VARPD|nr:hypothetical protein [Variovorax paradoxus]KLN54704.1 hypothetical protein VPARA_40080 [Variovorax paradoxus]